MGELIAAMIFMTIMVAINMIFMMWFLGKYSNRIDEESWRKLLCLLAEHSFYLTMVGCLICVEDIIRWFKQLCFISLLMIAINEFITLLLYSRLSITHRNTILTIDPVERAYLRLWDRMYAECFVLSFLGSTLYAAFCAYEVYN